MNLKEKQKLKNTLNSMFIKEDVTFKELDSIPKVERQDTINNELLRINKIALQWALQNKLITADELKDEKFITKNKHLTDFIADAGLGALGIGGATVGYNVAAAPIFLGFGGGFAAIGIGGAAITAAPILLAALFIYGKVHYKNKKEVEELIEYFNTEKIKIQKFYLSKINKMKEETIPLPIRDTDNIPTRKIEKQTPINKKTTPIVKEAIKEENKPIIKEIEKIDVDYDKCIVKYDDECTIKHEGLIWDKKDGLNYQTFEDSIDKVLKIVSDEIFNWESIEIIFIGIKSNVTKLKKKAKIFEKDNNIDKAIIIKFIDITKKVKS